jgi:hypothetical protein
MGRAARFRFSENLDRPKTPSRGSPRTWIDRRRALAVLREPGWTENALSRFSESMGHLCPIVPKPLKP